MLLVDDTVMWHTIRASDSETYLPGIFLCVRVAVHISRELLLCALLTVILKEVVKVEASRCSVRGLQEHIDDVIISVHCYSVPLYYQGK